MQSKRERAREIAEEGLDMIVDGEEKVGRRMIEHARRIDSNAVEELAEEIERDKENIARFVEKKIAGSVRKFPIRPASSRKT